MGTEGTESSFREVQAAYEHNAFLIRFAGGTVLSASWALAAPIQLAPLSCRLLRSSFPSSSDICQIIKLVTINDIPYVRTSGKCILNVSPSCTVSPALGLRLLTVFDYRLSCADEGHYWPSTATRGAEKNSGRWERLVSLFRYVLPRGVT